MLVVAVGDATKIMWQGTVLTTRTCVVLSLKAFVTAALVFVTEIVCVVVDISKDGKDIFNLAII